MSAEPKTNPETAGREVLLLGLDFGSTTSSALLARANVGSHCITGRMAFGEPRVVFRSEPVFTPFNGPCIDEGRVETLLSAWLHAASVGEGEIFAGGTLITGLAARRHNAAAIAGLVGRRIGETVIAAADDPCLESWLAFMGSCSALSRFHSTRRMLNLDIGGGTTNPAIGQNGNVQATGCYFVGARHFQFDPGGYTLSGISEFGEALLRKLGIDCGIGETLDDEARAAVLGYYVDALEAIVVGRRFFDDELGRRLEQVRFGAAADEDTFVTFSGGVGELLYRLVDGEPLPGTTAYGDLGIDLARAIAGSPVLSRDLRRCVPENRGRATVYGLTLHSTEVSGTTLFLPRPQQLPLRDLPVVALVPVSASAGQLDAALALVRTASQGACIQVALEGQARFGLDAVRQLGGRLAEAIKRAAIPPHHPIVLLIEPDAGKTLGQYATQWGRIDTNLIVIDEVALRNAHFVNIGRPRHQIVPVAFFGMH